MDARAYKADIMMWLESSPVVCSLVNWIIFDFALIYFETQPVQCGLLEGYPPVTGRCLCACYDGTDMLYLTGTEIRVCSKNLVMIIVCGKFGRGLGC